MQKLDQSNVDPNASSAFERATKALLRATVGRLGEEFLHELLAHLSQNLEFDSAIIGRWQDKAQSKIQTVSFYSDGKIQPNFDYPLENSHHQAILKHDLYLLSEQAQSEFPDDKVLAQLGAKSFIGSTLKGSQNQNIGFFVAYQKHALNNISLLTNMLEVFSYRVAAELERQVINQELQNEVQLNQTQLDSAPALMFMLNRQGEFLRWNQYLLSRFELDDKNLQHKKFVSLVHPKDRKRVELEMEQFFISGGGSIYLNGVTQNGEEVPLLITAETTTYEGEEVIVSVALDMTEQQNVERNLLRSQGRLARKNSQLSLINSLLEKLHTSRSIKHIAEQVVNLLHTLQRDSWIVFTEMNSDNQTMQIIASRGVSRGLLQTRQVFPFDEEGSPIGTAMRSQKLETFHSIELDKRLSSPMRTALIQEGVKAGVAMPFIYQGVALGCVAIGYKQDAEIPNDELEFYQTIGTSISLAMANARQYQSMKNLATIDSLTQLPNRNALNKDCQTYLKNLVKDDGFLGLILIDLDRFKEINDTLDHQIGDKLLQLIGPRLNQVLNDQTCEVYRLGGDEFCVLIAKKQQSSQVMKIAELIRQAIELPFVVDGLNLEISSSIGVATTLGVQHSASEMLRCAELAMYQIKNQGGGILQYSPDMDADTNQRFVIMAEMAEAIRNDELILHYQPKFDIKTGRIFACEALVRWQHKQYGLLPPAKFIPLVELTQLIHPLTHWVVKTAMTQIQTWKKQGVELSVAINLSTRNLIDDDFVEQVKRMMQEYDIQPGEIEFEVTETALISNLDRAMQQLHAFNDLGIKCSLDDYGTGYSSLSYIKKLPLNILKIDRSFISQMLDYSEDRIIAQSTINLAHNLGLKVVAEGVEDERTLQELTKQGCDLIQGYFISQPLDAESLAQLYWDNHPPIG